jgi:signal transduction histidine kinase
VTRRDAERARVTRRDAERAGVTPDDVERTRWLWRLAPLALLVVAVVGTVGADHNQTSPRGLDWLAIALVVIGPLSLWWWPRAPRFVLWLVIADTLVYFGRGYAYGPVIVTAAVVLFVAIVTGHRAAAWWGFFMLYVGHLALRHWVVDAKLTWGAAFGVAAWGIVVLSLAEIVRVRRERYAAAGVARREAARRRENEERLRIARDLHDVVAHHMSLINVQAGVALHLVDRQPEQVQTALHVIKAASREALTELRSLVGVLRDEADPAPRSPTSTLDSLDDLVQRSAVAGLTVRTRVIGTAVPLPAAVETAAFRIVQEAITNIVRHASAHRADISIDYQPAALVVVIEDDGVGIAAGVVPEDAAPAEGGGTGLRGMRERARALGGTVALSSGASGGLRVTATLPIGGLS